jgi:hypothetical protein
VKFDPNGPKVSCSCKKFEFVGVLCCHALKVLDHNNIKELAPEYFLKRWTRHAKKGSSQAIQKCVNDEDTRVMLARWYRSLCHSYNNILSKAAERDEAYALLQIASIELMEKVDQIMHGNQSEDISPNCKEVEKQPVKCNKEKEVQVQGIKPVKCNKEPGSSSKRMKSGLEQNSKAKPKKGMLQHKKISIYIQYVKETILMIFLSKQGKHQSTRMVIVLLHHPRQILVFPCQMRTTT